jgi:hypothetical protein
MPSTHKAWKVPVGKTLSYSIREDTSFDFKDMLLWLLKDKDVGAAEAIYETFGGEKCFQLAPPGFPSMQF